MAQNKLDAFLYNILEEFEDLVNYLLIMVQSQRVLQLLVLQQHFIRHMSRPSEDYEITSHYITAFQDNALSTCPAAASFTSQQLIKKFLSNTLSSALLSST